MTHARGLGFATVILGESFVIADWTDPGSTSRERPIAGLHLHLHLHRSDDDA